MSKSVINLLVKTANKLDNLDPKLADELDALISKLASPTCPTCYDEGTVEKRITDPYGNLVSTDAPCPDCGENKAGEEENKTSAGGKYSNLKEYINKPVVLKLINKQDSTIYQEYPADTLGNTLLEFVDSNGNKDNYYQIYDNDKLILDNDDILKLFDKALIIEEDEYFYPDEDYHFDKFNLALEKAMNN